MDWRRQERRVFDGLGVHWLFDRLGRSGFHFSQANCAEEDRLLVILDGDAVLLLAGDYN